MARNSRPGTVLQIVSQAQMELGLSQAAVSTVVASLDHDIKQMQALLHAVASEVLMQEPYKETLGDGYWISAPDGTLQEVFVTDSDLVLFDARMAIEGLKYRFLKAKGLEYGEELRDFTTRLNIIASDINGRVLDLDAEGGRVQ